MTDSGSNKPGAPVVPISHEARIRELEQTCEEQARAILQLHAVLEAHERRLALLELHIKNGNGGTQSALREASELAKRAAERRTK